MSLRSCLLLLLRWLWDLLWRGWTLIKSRIVQELNDLGWEHGLLDLRDHLHYPFLDHGLRLLLILLRVIYFIRGLHLFCLALPLTSRPSSNHYLFLVTPSYLRVIQLVLDSWEELTVCPTTPMHVVVVMCAMRR